MSDRAALLAAICANPDENTLRLVYADWLEENGDAKRAAFIRARVEQHQRETADTAANAVFEFADTRYSWGVKRLDWSVVDADLGNRVAVVKAIAKEKFKLTAKGEGLPRIKGVLFFGNERGFLSKVLVEDTPAFLKHAEAIFRAAPVTSATFQILTADQARELVDS